MKASKGLWKEKLGTKVPESFTTELDVYENEIALKKQDRIEERQGAYP